MDTVLAGGFVKGSTILVEGAPGAGKTTLALQFLKAGAALGDAGLYLTFEELPDQIYADAAEFGWDLHALEAEGLLRVVSTSADALLAELLEPGGWVDEMVQELGIKRVALDSVTLVSQLTRSGDSRPVLFTIRSALRRLGVTSLLIREVTELDNQTIAADAYLSDTWIRIGQMPPAGYDGHRMTGVRSLQVLKHRSSNFQAGHHVLRVSDRGLSLVPARIQPPHILWQEEDRKLISTGIRGLDAALDGGLVGGATYLIDTNSKANYTSIILAMESRHLKAGGGLVVLLSSAVALTRLPDNFGAYGVDVVAAAQEGRFVAIDGYQRTVPPDLAPYVLPHHDRESIIETRRRLREMLEADVQWMVVYDMNTVISTLGVEYIRETFSQQVSSTRDHGIPFIASCNFSEVPSSMASYLERTVNGVIHTWHDGRYQYVQVTKSPSGKTTDPLVVVPLPEPPFVDLA